MLIQVYVLFSYILIRRCSLKLFFSYIFANLFSFTCWIIQLPSGWKWKGGNKLHDYLYLKPNISTIKDKREGIDYFVEEDHVKKYASIKYGWSNSLANNSDDDSTNDSVSSSLTDNDETNKKLAIKSPKKEPTTTNRTPNTHNIIRDINISSDDSTECVEMSHVKKKQKLGNQNPSSVKVIKGSKTKPGMISF